MVAHKAHAHKVDSPGMISYSHLLNSLASQTHGSLVVLFIFGELRVELYILSVAISTPFYKLANPAVCLAIMAL